MECGCVFVVWGMSRVATTWSSVMTCVDAPYLEPTTSICTSLTTRSLHYMCQKPLIERDFRHQEVGPRPWLYNVSRVCVSCELPLQTRTRLEVKGHPCLSWSVDRSLSSLEKHSGLFIYQRFFFIISHRAD